MLTYFTIQSTYNNFLHFSLIREFAFEFVLCRNLMWMTYLHRKPRFFPYVVHKSLHLECIQRIIADNRDAKKLKRDKGKTKSKHWIWKPTFSLLFCLLQSKRIDRCSIFSLMSEIQPMHFILITALRFEVLFTSTSNLLSVSACTFRRIKTKFISPSLSLFVVSCLLSFVRSVPNEMRIVSRISFVVI